MKYVEAPYGYERAEGDIPLFLAGGITGCPDWQKVVAMLLRRENFEKLVVLNPRRENFPIHDPNAGYEQIRWEWEMFREAEIILFWFARGSLNPIVLFEYGKWMVQKEKRIFVGCDLEYQRTQDVEIQTELERKDIRIVHDLQGLVNQIKEYLEKKVVSEK